MSNCCPFCKQYEKYPGYDLCCRTCRDTRGQDHGRGCARKACARSATTTTTSTLNCSNLFKNTALETVKFAIKCNGFNSVIDIKLKNYPNRPGQPVVIISFGNSSDANNFSRYSGNAQINANTNVILGSVRAQQIFNKMGIGKFGRSSPRDMYDALKYELTSSTSTSSSTVYPQAQTQRTNNCSNLITGQPLYNSSTHVCFYEATQPYYEFTNFYPAPITISGKTYPTSEHYFQAQKFATTDPALAEKIRTSASPRDAFNLARTNQRIEPNWHAGLKDKVMKDALIAKFVQYPYIRSLLVGTGDKILVEHTTKDKYWGDGGDGSGVNKLGKLLMEVRNDIKNGQYGGSTNKSYYDKYVKYKKKYLQLKKNN